MSKANTVCDFFKVKKVFPFLLDSVLILMNAACIMKLMEKSATFKQK
jgi:hypothetical protein